MADPLTPQRPVPDPVRLVRIRSQAAVAVLFVIHSRVAIVFNGSPLFAGDAGSGEINIRQWIIENNCPEAVVAFPKEVTA